MSGFMHEYQKDQKVKVRLVDPKGYKWHDGTYVAPDTLTDSHAVKVAGKSREFKDNDVTHFHPLNDDKALHEHGVKTVDELEYWLKKAVAKLISPGIEIKKVVNANEVYLEVVGYGITLQPAPFETHRLIGIKEVEGWEVTAIKTTPGNREQPDDYEPVRLAINRDTMRVAADAVKVMFQIMSDGFWEQEANAIAADDYKRDEELANEYFRTTRGG